MSNSTSAGCKDSANDERIGGGEIIVAGDEGEVLEDADARPDDCMCTPAFGDLPCWPCYRAGFDEPNPKMAADEEGS